MIRTYTATLVIPAAGTAGTVQMGNTFDPVTGFSGGGVPVNGRLYAVQLAFGGGTAGSLTLKTAGQGGPQLTLLTLTNVSADAWYFPRIQTQNNAGANNGTTIVDQYPVDDNVQFAITNGGTAGTVVAKMLLFQ